MFNFFIKKKKVRNPRQLIIANLNKIVIPKLIDTGFTGVFPYFRRKQGNILSVVSFQFNKYGGSFVVEFACTNNTDRDLPEFAKNIPFENLDGACFSPTNRIRLKPVNQLFSHWFSYKDFSKESQFEKLAQLVKDLLPVGEEFCQFGRK